jgi:hypothetical protein
MKVALSVASILVIALMMAMPVSAGPRTVTFDDRQGDLGKNNYAWGQGSHEWGDPLSWWQGDSPIANAGYLDMLSGWVTARGGTVTMGLVLNSSLPSDGMLPNGVTEVRWAWFFYLSIDTYSGGNNANNYAVYVVWNENGLSTVLVDRTSGSSPFSLTYLDTLVVDENVLTVIVSSESIAGAIAWFSETLIMNGHPWPLDQMAPNGGWQAPDLTDFQGPLAIWWPWLTMP